LTEVLRNGARTLLAQRGWPRTQGRSSWFYHGWRLGRATCALFDAREAGLPGGSQSPRFNSIYFTVQDLLPDPPFTQRDYHRSSFTAFVDLGAEYGTLATESF